MLPAIKGVMLVDLVKRGGRALGLEITHYRPSGRRRMDLLAEHGIELVLDVGADRGQYATDLRRHGYRGRIVSFEPLQETFEELARAAAQDPRWECHPLALGATGGRMPIWVTSNLASSSLLPMLHAHVQAAPDVEVVSQEIADVRKLDSLDLQLDVPTLLKLDVQGYEDRVLAGAEQTLEDVALVECELSIEPLYDSQVTVLDMLKLLQEAGFRLVSLEPGFHDQAGRILQFEALLARETTSGER